MRTKKQLFLFASACVLAFSSCSKTEDPPAPNNNNNNPPVTASQVCDGNNSRSYFPLKIGNSWTSSTGSGTETKSITKDTVIQGKTYFVLSYKSAMNGDTHESFFRMDPNGDVFEYRDYNNGSTSPYTKEYLFMPYDAADAVGFQWEFPPALIHEGKMNKRLVTSNNGSVKTDKCNYSALVEITEYDSEGNVYATYFFKKGLGKVRETVFSNKDLNGVTLK